MTSNSQTGTLTIEKAFVQLLTILKTAKEHTFVRKAVVNSICNQIWRLCEEIETKKPSSSNFLTIASQLQQIFSQLTQNELNEIVAKLTECYLKQRENQKEEGTNDEIEINGHRYPIWTKSERPPTSIEQAILLWLGSENYPVAQQVAMRAKVEFARVLDREEAEYIQNGREKGEVITEEKDSRKISLVDAPKFPLIGKIATFWGAKPYKGIISTLLPEASTHNESRQNELTFVLNEWKEDKNANKDIGHNLKLGTISERLNVGITLKKYWPLLVIGSTLVIFPTFTTVFSLMSYIGHGVNSVITSASKPSKTENSTIANNLVMPESERGIPIFSDMNIADEDSSNFNGGKLTVSITNAMPGDILWIPNQSPNSGVITIDGSNLLYRGETIGSLKGGQGTIPLEVSFNEKATPEAAQVLLHSIKYANVAKQPVVGIRKAQFQISDGGENGLKDSPTKDINVITENQAPTISSPSNTAVKENNSIFINGLTVSDTDSQNITVSLKTTQGALTVKPGIPNGLTAKNIINNKSRDITLTGTVGQINATLADPKSIVYQAGKEADGNDSITISAKDDGKTIPTTSEKIKTLVWPLNANETKTADNKALNITILPIKPPPVIGIVESNKTVKENTDLMITGITITDPNSPKQTVILSTQKGTISVKDKVPQGFWTLDKIVSLRTIFVN